MPPKKKKKATRLRSARDGKYTKAGPPAEVVAERRDAVIWRGYVVALPDGDFVRVSFPNRPMLFMTKEAAAEEALSCPVARVRSVRLVLGKR